MGFTKDPTPLGKEIPMNKRVTAIGLAAGLLAGAGAGLALELSGSAGAASGNNVMVAAGETGTSDTGAMMPGGMMPGGPGRGVDFASVLQPLVSDGTLTQAQADAVLAALQAAAPQGGPRMARLETVAGVLGITADEVRTAVQGGQTIADLAVANGKTAQDVIDALVAEVEQHFADEVASGEHTQADADARIADATTRITEFVNNTQSAMPDDRGPGHRHGPGHGPGMGDDMDDAMGGGMGGGAIDGGPTDTVTTAP